MAEITDEYVQAQLAASREYFTYEAHPLAQLPRRRPARRRSVTLAEARDHGYPRIDWEVLDWNELAKDLYRRLGATHNDTWENWRLTGSALAALQATLADARTSRPRRRCHSRWTDHQRWRPTWRA
jgi:hypothetical protein